MPSTLGKLTPGFNAKLNIWVDVSLVIGCTFLAGYLSGRPLELSPVRACALALCLAAVWTATTLVLRYYDAWAQPSRLQDAALVSLLVLGIGAILPFVETRRVLDSVALIRTGYFVALLWPTLLALRLLVFRPLLRSIRNSSQEDILILGTGPLGRATGEDLNRTSHRLLGYLQVPNETQSKSLPAELLGSSKDLELFLRRLPIGEVYIAASTQTQGGAMQAAIAVCERFGVPFALPAYGFRFNRARTFDGSDFADGYTHYTCVESKPHQMAVKRLIDITASAIALVLLSPLFIGVSIAIKLTSTGLVFFKQVRSGLYGRSFHMLKFRSMSSNAEAMQAQLVTQNEQGGPVFKIKNDPRVTRIGRFIRKYSIDELPQLLNVLRGDMSIVGPRPPVPGEVAKYEPWQRRRLSMRPGLTCIWQVSGRNNISFEQWMMLDMEYIDHWSLGSDLGLILQTVPVVLTGRGAS
jgi:exopolysaccharide biosynthesis polyprenyl glycosylphosphotransferase